MDYKISEPLPSNAYALPKDHKEVQLKVRPIISTTDSFVRPLAQLFSNLLMPIIKDNVMFYIQSTSDFINEIKQVMFNVNMEFGSLNVVNLYGSIPLEDNLSVNSIGLISTVIEFFDKCWMTSVLPDIKTADFKVLLKLLLYTDVYLMDDQMRMQNKGIAMGNCAAPALAIIFMDSIEALIFNKCSGIIF